MDETRARRETVGQATMFIDGEYSSETPPMQIISVKRKDSDKKIVWMPGEVLPRYAKRICAETGLDVACGNVRYYRWSANYGPKSDRPLAYTLWWIGPSAEDLDMSQITMEVR